MLDQKSSLESHILSVVVGRCYQTVLVIWKVSNGRMGGLLTSYVKRPTGKSYLPQYPSDFCLGKNKAKDFKAMSKL